jgi:hypothetical protein
VVFQVDERVKDVRFTEDTISVDLMDGRSITVPLVWYPRLLNASPEKLAQWEICGGGYGIHWEDLDEDLSTEGMLRWRSDRTPGAPAFDSDQFPAHIASALADWKC